MMHLPQPEGAGDDHFEAIWQAERWLPYREAWVGANAAYRDAGGSPWQVAPMGLGGDIEVDQRLLWEGRRKSARVDAIRHVSVPCCPMCGSQNTGAVDHYLPKETFAEFSILFENLVPACANCNSAGKGKIYRGEADPERFIHPYYDDWANVAIWKVEIEPPYEAPTFSAAPLAGLAAPIASIVSFHLKHVLGKQWLGFNERTWGALPDRLIGRTPEDAPITPDAVRAKLETRQWDADHFDGINSWNSALLRGIRGSEGAVAHIASRTEKVAALLIE